VKRLFFLIFIILTIGTSQAQFVSRLGRFQVDQVRGCVPFTITFTNILAGECSGLKPCLIDFLGNNLQVPGTPTQLFTYLQAGTFKLSVLYGSIIPQVDDITIVVDPNIQPAFEIYTCSGSQVSVKITDKNYDKYDVDFGDGSAIVPIPSGNNQVTQHTYASNGNYNIGVKGRKNGAANNCNALVQSFTAVTALPLPQITQLAPVDPIGPTTLKIDFVQQTNIQYKSEIATNSASFLQFQTLYGVNSLTIPNLRLDDNYYCFRLRSYDPCLGNDQISLPICSHNFDLTISSDLNKLDWQTNSTGVASVDILRDKGIYTNIPMPVPFTYSDADIKCNITYCYQLTSNYSGGAKSISLEKCGKAFTTITPSAIVNTSSVVSTKGVQLSWIQDPKFSTTAYNIFRSQNQGTFFSLATSATPQYQDGTYNSDSQFCYLINYKDQCNNNSADSSPICPIRLQGLVSDEDKISLLWNEYTGWNLGVKNYVIEKYDQKGTLLKTIDVGINKTYLEDPADLQNQIVSYRIIANANETGLTTSVSNQITLTKEINLFYPTAFTPDRKGPAENEIFTVKGQFIARAELSIFDRWGSLIFYSDKNEPWDGTQSGQPMPIASYVWTANIVDMAGRSLKRSGTVLLLRK
jgi:gliding motility-associated-like protein